MDVTKTEPVGKSAPVSLCQPTWRNSCTAIGVTVLYALSAFIGLKLAVVHGNVTAIWPPSGIALAALLLFGSRFWPAVTAGAFIVSMSTGIPLAASIGIASGNTLAALAGLELVRRLIGDADPLGSVRSQLALLGGGALLATVLSATVGVTTLALTGLAPATELLPIWLTWWLGDATGVIIFAPLFLAWAASGRLGNSILPGRYLLRTIEALVLAASLVFTSQLVFGGWFVTGSENYPLAFLPLPLLIWAGFRFGIPGATAAVAMTSLLAIWGTVLGYGPFVHADLNQSLLLLQVFMSVNAVTTLILVAVLQERDAIRYDLQQARNELEQRVQERTRALLEANRFLLEEVREHRALQERVGVDARSAQAAMNRDAAEIRQVYERISRSVHEDVLTAPADANIFTERLEAALQYARLVNRKVALLHVAIDGAGDDAFSGGNAIDAGLLEQVVQRLQSVLRDTDTLVRQGEDGFAILLEGVRELDDLASVAERIIHEICIPFIAGQAKIYLAASVGISIFPEDATDAPKLRSHAAAAMRLAREGGGRKYHFHIEERAAIDAEVGKLIGDG